MSVWGRLAVITLVLTTSGLAGAQETTVTSLRDLARLSYPELDALYRQSAPGAIPTGYLRGRAIYPDGPLSAARTRVSRTLWKGKRFADSGDELVNRWVGGLRAVRARVEYGDSWLDGQPSIVMDYEGTSRLIWSDVRDEVREVAPGLFLGVMFRREGRHPEMKMYFALEESRSGACGSGPEGP